MRDRAQGNCQASAKKGRPTWGAGCHLDPPESPQCRCWQKQRQSGTRLGLGTARSWGRKPRFLSWFGLKGSGNEVPGLKAAWGAGLAGAPGRVPQWASGDGMAAAGAPGHAENGRLGTGLLLSGKPPHRDGVLVLGPTEPDAQSLLPGQRRSVWAQLMGGLRVLSSVSGHSTVGCGGRQTHVTSGPQTRSSAIFRFSCGHGLTASHRAIARHQGWLLDGLGG